MHPISPVAQPIPPTAVADIFDMLETGDLFRYTAAADAPVSRLEKEFAEFMGVPFALAVNSCSSAIFLALKALGLGAGERVLVPAFTFAAVPSAVVHAGCEPVLVNIGPDLRLDIDDFERKLTPEIRAVLLSHMRGHVPDLDAITGLCEARNVAVIEDAAHSLGSTWAGRKVGTIGHIGCFSFQSYKLVNAGEGGMLIARDPDLIARAVIMSGAYEHNWKKHAMVNERFAYWQNRLPLYGLRMNNLSAVVALSQLAHVPQRAKRGQKNHDRLAARLIASRLFSVPQPLARERRAPDSIQFELRGSVTGAELREFRRIAMQKGVQVEIFGLSKDNARAFWNWEFLDPQDGLSSTRKILERTCDVRLPVQLESADLDLIADALVATAEALECASAPVDSRTSELLAAGYQDA